MAFIHSRKMLDFGVARLVEAVNYNSDKSKRSSFDVAGTPLYMAPEQSSQTQYPADHRADLYSLGCVMYEMLTGIPPFQADSREQLESMHAHLVAQQVSSHRTDLPHVVSKVIDRLLAKSPSDRYQSAFSLLTDLDEIEKLLTVGSNVSFKIGRNDGFNATPLQIKFVGRQECLGFLDQDYLSLSGPEARSRLAVVSGESGIGKTRLLAEYKSQLASRGIPFIGANFNQHENSLPFNALANGLNDYLSVLSKTEPIKADELKRKIKALLGQTASMIAAIVPGLKPFLPEEARKKDFVLTDASFPLFSKVFSDFTKCLAVDDKPVIFIFDDLHWADQKSLLLIDHFFSLNNSQRFFLVLSCRPEQPGLSPWFNTFLEKFRKLKRRFREINLSPVVRGEVYKYAAAMLPKGARPSESLVDFLLEASQGRPMYLIEMIRTLVRRNLLSVEPGEDGRVWCPRLEEIEKQPVILNSIDIALDRLVQVSGDYRAVLEAAAVYGLVFQLKILESVFEEKEIDVQSFVAKAIDEGLLAPSAGHNDSAELGLAYSFIHWQAREVLYSQMGPARRREIHGQVAAKIIQLAKAKSPKLIFAIAHHDHLSLDHGKTKNINQAVSSVQIAVTAGRVARQSGAWQSAESYFESALKILEAWDKPMVPNQIYITIKENIADLAILQRKNGRALQNLAETMKLRLDQQSWLRLAAKSIYVRMISGQVTSNDESAKRFLKQLGYVPGWTLTILKLLSRLRHHSEAIWPSLALKTAKRDLARLLKKKNRQSLAKTGDSGDFLVSMQGRSAFFSVCAQFYATQNLSEESFALYLGLSELRRGRLDLETGLRLLADKSIMFAKMQGWKSARLQIALIQNFAKSRKLLGLYNYTKAIGQIWKIGTPSTHTILQHVENLDRAEYRMLHITAMEYQIYRATTLGDFATVSRFMHLVPYSIPTRHWLSVRAMAMSFFALILTESRSYLSSIGEEYLRRRVDVSARRDDVFSLVILTVVTFARGEQASIREAYSRFIMALKMPQDQPSLSPFEDEFLMVFALVFPLLFEKEYGRLLNRNEEMRSYSKIVDRRIKKAIHRQGVIFALLQFRAKVTLKPKAPLGQSYLKILKYPGLSAKPLFEGLALLWLGQLFSRQNPKKYGGLLLKASDLFSTLGFSALESYTDALIERLVPSFHEMEKKRRRVIKTGSLTLLDEFDYYHLEHLAAIMEVARPVTQVCEESMAVLKGLLGQKRS